VSRESRVASREKGSAHFTALALVCILRLLLPSFATAQAAELARADSAWARGDWREARRLYEAVLEGDPDQSRAIYRLARLAPSRDSSIALARRYTELEPDDAWGWFLLGGEWLKAGRPRRAARALGQAHSLEPDPDIAHRWRLAQALNGPALEPLGGWQGDSDGYRTARFGMKGDWSIGDGTRMGLLVGRSSISDATRQVSVMAGQASLTARPGAAWRVELGGGAARADPDSLGDAWTTGTGSLRVRWRPSDRGALVELRADRLPLGTTPDLVLNRAVRSEMRGMVEAPAGSVRLRAGGRAGGISSTVDDNSRYGIDAGLARPLGSTGELSAQYHRLRYEHATVAGYFAPQWSETLEGGTYLEWEWSAWSLALDGGLGAQRTRRFDMGVEPAWGLAARLWASVARSAGAGRELRLELDSSNAPGQAGAVGTSEQWKFLSLLLSLRWAL